MTLHPEKTRIVDMSQARASFDFLGYRFLRTKPGKLIRLIRPKSQQKLRAALRPITRRCNKHSMKDIIELINPKLRGWFGYFKHAQPAELHSMDQWLRMRLRSILRKRKGSRGIGRGRDHLHWPNRYFEILGLFNLKAAREELLSLLRGAKR